MLTTATAIDYAPKKKMSVAFEMGIQSVKVVDYSDYRQILQLYARKLILVNILC